MPKVNERIDLKYPIGTIWRFASDTDLWAPLVPGYIRHHKRNHHATELECKINLGMLKKTLKFYIEMNDGEGSYLIPFQFASESHSIFGHGILKGQALSLSETRIFITAHITVQGAMAPIVNTFIANAKSKFTQEIISAFEEKINKMKNGEH